jgi:hypothetical protein
MLHVTRLGCRFHHTASWRCVGSIKQYPWKDICVGVAQADRFNHSTDLRVFETEQRKNIRRSIRETVTDPNMNNNIQRVRTTSSGL